jgi:prophage DNA circulation protein
VGKTIDEIKTILRDSVSVLVDLSIQIGRVKQFFTMLTTVIDEVVMPRAGTFNKEMDKAGRRATRDGAIKVDNISKQLIYTSTLQLKAYFSLLQDIASMYNRVHRQYIIQGIELCATLSKSSANNDPRSEVQERLSKYTEESALAVSKLVEEKQQEILKGLRDRARIAAEGVQLLKNTAAQKGFAIDDGSRKAIQSGAQTVEEDTKALLEAHVSATVGAELDANAF